MKYSNKTQKFENISDLIFFASTYFSKTNMYSMADVLKEGEVSHLDETTLKLVNTLIANEVAGFIPVQKKMQTCIKLCEKTIKVRIFLRVKFS